MNQEKIEQYVAGKLGQEEAEAFEVYCIENPEFARQVEFEQRLRAGIAQVARGSTAEFVRSAEQPNWRLAIAASVLLAALVGVFIWQRSAPFGAVPVMAAVTTEAQRDTPVLRLALVRGAESSSGLGAAPTRIEIVGLFDPGYHYTISLDRLAGSGGVENISTLYGQHPTSPVTLEVIVDGHRLRAGAYTLRVRKQGSDDEPLEFSFERR